MATIILLCCVYFLFLKYINVQYLKLYFKYFTEVEDIPVVVPDQPREVLENLHHCTKSGCNRCCSFENMQAPPSSVLTLSWAQLLQQNITYG